jgi:hypothetical protein
MCGVWLAGVLVLAAGAYHAEVTPIRVGMTMSEVGKALGGSGFHRCPYAGSPGRLPAPAPTDPDVPN